MLPEDDAPRELNVTAQVVTHKNLVTHEHLPVATHRSRERQSRDCCSHGVARVGGGFPNWISGLTTTYADIF